MKFRVTYYPGTADLFRRNCPCCVCCTEVNGDKQAARVQELFDRIEQVRFFDFPTYKDALNGTVARYIGTSDGVLIEYVKECATCKETFYTRAEDAKLCDPCGEASVLA